MNLIALTDAALNRLTEIKRINPNIVGLFIKIEKGGCAGMEYKLDLVEHVPQNIEIVEAPNVKIFIDKGSLLYLLGTEIDFQATIVKTGFVLNNPNQTAACGCGESVTLKAFSEIVSN